MTPSSSEERFEQVKERWLKSSGITTLDFIKSELDKQRVEIEGEWKRRIEYLWEHLESAEQDKAMADDPDDPKVRIVYFKKLLSDLLRSKT